MGYDRIYLKSRQEREANAFNGKPASTTRSDYKPLDVSKVRKEERIEYQKNKGKARVAGEWWSQQGSKDQSHTNYHDSYQRHNYAEWMKRIETLPIAGNRSGVGTPASGGNGLPGSSPSILPVLKPKDPMANWNAHRVKKPIRDDFGKNYDILTGTQLQSMPGSRGANRVSFDKISARQGRDRNYDIISNMQYVSVPLDDLQ
ncbi:hypothetical protein DFS34DRAFT_634820 [Phlyctochytrium arcticum]|nr:hypothetical protein DFS34DRAFT_634820 [Phlyctochytrium arcticum]